jgi:hypothetical protein
MAAGLQVQLNRNNAAATEPMKQENNMMQTKNKTIWYPAYVFSVRSSRGISMACSSFS